MHAPAIAEDAAEIKAEAATANKFWIAMCVDVVRHEVVGAQVRTPKAHDPSRHAWQPFALWIWMLTEAAHVARKRFVEGVGMVALKRGQLAASERFLCEKANWGRKAVRVFLERLERLDMVRVERGAPRAQLSLALPAPGLNGIQKGPPLSIISICNYERYQHAPQQKGPGGAQEGPRRGPGGAQNSTSLHLDKDSQSGRGSSGRSYWQQQLNPGLGDIQYVDGQLTLLNGSHAKWLAEFDGDERRLRLALGEIHIEPNSTIAIATQVERKLSRICREAVERDRRAERSVKARGAASSPVNHKVRAANDFLAATRGQR